MNVPLTIADHLRRGALVYGDRIGVVDEADQPGPSTGNLTYAQIAAKAKAQAAGFDALGIPEGARIAIVSHNAARLLVSFFGVSAYGRVLVPINFRLNADEIAFIVEHSGAEVLLVDAEVDEALAGIVTPHRYVIGEQTDALEVHGIEPRYAATDEDATATINYTSGTTARPKGVQLTHRNLWVNAVTFALHLGVTDRDVYLHTLPMFHANGWGMPYIMAGLGGKQIVLRKVDGPEILRRIDQHGVTLLCGSPAVVNTILDAAKDWDGEVPGRGRVRIVVAGAPPPTRTVERVETELGWELIQIYGLTETSPLLTMTRGRAESDALSPEERARYLNRAGAPALGVEIAVDTDGEVLARGNVICAGYWEQPDATEAAMAGGWFHTGDGGHLDGAYLAITDRKKDVIISGGENVSSIEVEDVLQSHPAVLEAAAIGVPDAKWGETVKGLVVLAEHGSVDAQQLIDHCRAKLAHYKCPTTVDIVDELPRTATGKLQKFKLRAPYWEGHDRQIN